MKGVNTFADNVLIIFWHGPRPAHFLVETGLSVLVSVGFARPERPYRARTAFACPFPHGGRVRSL